METTIEHDYRNELLIVVTCPVINIHDVRSHWRNTLRCNTSAVHNIVRFRYQRIDVTILYFKSQLMKSCYIHKWVLKNVTSLRSYLLRALNVGAGLNLTGISMSTQYPHSEGKIVT